MGATAFASLTDVIQQPQQLAPTGFGWALGKMILALLLVCVVAYLVLRVLRRHLVHSGGRGSLLRLVERCPLSARQGLWVVEVAGRFFLIGATDGTIVKLAELEREAVESVKGGQPPPARRFRHVLEKMLARPGEDR